MITTVTSSAALNAALKTAQAGDTLKLAPGTYAGVSAANLHFAQDVTITSLDPTSAAIITRLNVSGSSGLTFANLEFQANAAGGDNPFKVSSSRDIHFDRLNVHGSLDGNPQNDVAAFLIRSSADVSVTNSEFQQLNSAIAHLDVTGLTLTGNEFHDLRMDGIRGGGSSFVTISDNTFRDFYPAVGDHADAIQFWTSNTTTSAHDISITNNLFLRGSGAVAQGVFLRDEVGGLPYQHVTISGNFIIGGMYNGIAVLGGRDVSVTGNVVAGFQDMKSWIRIEKVDGGTVSGNSANTYLTTLANTNLVITGNLTIAQATDQGAAAYLQWSQLHPGNGMSLTGGSGADTLTGGSDSDTLAGGGGADQLVGGQGDDLYITDRFGKIVETVDGGVDTVRTPDSITLPANVENLQFTGVKGAWGGGNSLNNQMTGNAGANHLSGAAGSDTLDGGAGADFLTGGRGADVLIGGPGADTFIFSPGAGADVIRDFGAGGEHDVLDLSALFTANLRPTLSEGPGGVTLSFTSGDSIRLEGVYLIDLHATQTGYVF